MKRTSKRRTPFDSDNDDDDEEEEEIAQKQRKVNKKLLKEGMKKDDEEDYPDGPMSLRTGFLRKKMKRDDRLIEQLKKDEVKKTKSLKEKMFIELKRKKKPKTPISDLQKAMNLVYKKKAKDDVSIGQAIAELKWVPDTKTKELLKTVANFKVNNNKISLTDKLLNTPLYSYYSCSFQNVQSLTDDHLYLWYIFVASCKYNKNEQLLSIIENADFAKVYIVSGLTNDEGKLYKGYYQDFDGDFCALNLNALSNESRNRILDFQGESFTFNYKSKTFKTYGNQVSCLICPENMSKEDVLLKYSSMKTLQIKNKNIELGMKEVQVKNKPKFLSCKLKGESFCPCFMVLPKPLPMNMFYKIYFDNNLLYNYILNQCKNVKVRMAGVSNLCYWDTLETFYEFMKVMYLASYDELRGINLKIIHDFIERYEKLKPALMLWKNLQLTYQRLLYEYYNCFTTKVIFDRLMKIRDKLKIYLESRAFLMKDASYILMQQMFEDINMFAGYIVNQFDSNVMYIGDKMFDMLNDLDAGEISESEVKQIGLAIYMVSSADDKLCTPTFPFILSPGGFLGDVIGDNVEEGHEKTLGELIDTMKSATRKVEMENKFIIKNINKIVSNLTDDQLQIVANTVDYVAQYKDIDLDNSMTRDGICDEVFKTIKNDGEIMDNINAIIINGRMMGNKKYQYEICKSSKLLNVILKILIERGLIQKDEELKLQKELISNQIEQNKIKAKEMKIKNQINNIKSNKYNSKLEQINEEPSAEEENKYDKKINQNLFGLFGEENPYYQPINIPKSKPPNIFSEGPFSSNLQLQQQQQNLEDIFKNPPIFNNPPQEQKNAIDFKFIPNPNPVFDINQFDISQISKKNLDNTMTEMTFLKDEEKGTTDFTKQEKFVPLLKSLTTINDGKLPGQLIDENGNIINSKMDALLKKYYLALVANSGEAPIDLRSEPKKHKTFIDAYYAYKIDDEILEETEKLINEDGFDFIQNINDFYKGGKFVGLNNKKLRRPKKLSKSNQMIPIQIMPKPKKKSKSGSKSRKQSSDEDDEEKGFLSGGESGGVKTRSQYRKIYGS